MAALKPDNDSLVDIQERRIPKTGLDGERLLVRQGDSENARLSLSASSPLHPPDHVCAIGPCTSEADLGNRDHHRLVAGSGVSNASECGSDHERQDGDRQVVTEYSS